MFEIRYCSKCTTTHPPNINVNNKARKGRPKTTTTKLPPPPSTCVLHDREQPPIQSMPDFQSNAIMAREEMVTSPTYGQRVELLVELARLYSWEDQRKKALENEKEDPFGILVGDEEENIEEFEEFEFSNDLDNAMVHYESPLHAQATKPDKRLREPTGLMPDATKKPRKEPTLAARVAAVKGKSKDPAEGPGLTQQNLLSFIIPK